MNTVDAEGLVDSAERAAESAKNSKRRAAVAYRHIRANFASDVFEGRSLDALTDAVISCGRAADSAWYARQLLATIQGKDSASAWCARFALLKAAEDANKYAGAAASAADNAERAVLACVWEQIK